MTEDSNLASQIAAKLEYGQAVCAKIAQTIGRLGFPAESTPNPPEFKAAVFSLITDPYTQNQNLSGFWYNAQQQRIGQIRFNDEGGFYAEYDVVQAHPSKKGLFVEAINAWGNKDNIKSEAKLLDIPQ